MAKLRQSKHDDKPASSFDSTDKDLRSGIRFTAAYNCPGFHENTKVAKRDPKPISRGATYRKGVDTQNQT